MDEISMVTQLRPEPPAEAYQIRERARRQLEAAITAAESPRPAGTFRRTRRRLTLSAAAVAAAASAVIAGPALLPASTGSSLVTPAWAVQQSPHGTITITIRKTLSNQAGLQRALRSDGIQAYVRSMTGCQYWEPPGGITQIRTSSKALLFPEPGNSDRNFSEIIIHPAELPKGDAVFIGGATFKSGTDKGGTEGQLFIMRDDGPPVCVPARGQ
jgi:hypothetical protein